MVRFNHLVRCSPVDGDEVELVRELPGDVPVEVHTRANQRFGPDDLPDSLHKVGLHVIHPLDHTSAVDCTHRISSSEMGGPTVSLSNHKPSIPSFSSTIAFNRSTISRANSSYASRVTIPPGRDLPISAPFHIAASPSGEPVCRKG